MFVKKQRLFGPGVLSAMTVSSQRLGYVPVLWCFCLGSCVLEGIDAESSH